MSETPQPNGQPKIICRDVWKIFGRAPERVLAAIAADATGGRVHYQDVCPKCRRALFGLAQGALWRREAG